MNKFYSNSVAGWLPLAVRLSSKNNPIQTYKNYFYIQNEKLFAKIINKNEMVVERIKSGDRGWEPLGLQEKLSF